MNIFIFIGCIMLALGLVMEYRTQTFVQILEQGDQLIIDWRNGVDHTISDRKINVMDVIFHKHDRFFRCQFLGFALIYSSLALIVANHSFLQKIFDEGISILIIGLTVMAIVSLLYACIKR